MSDRALLIAIHDVCEETLPECQTLAGWVHAIDSSAPLTLLVVPHYHGRERLEHSHACRRWLEARVSRGDELVLHGERHLDEAPPPRTLRDLIRRRVLTAAEGEFAALCEDEAAGRMLRGLQTFAACGFETRGFVPPAWAINQHALRAARRFPFTYLTDTGGFHHLASVRYRRAIVIGASARSLLRRQLSAAWLRIAAFRYADVPCVRVALHPIDARYPSIQRAWMAALSQLLSTRTPLTKSAWLESTGRS